MPRSLCYADAVTLLGGHGRVVAALDRLTGGLLLAASAAGGGFVLSLFDAKGELARLGSELVGGLGDRLRGLGRFDRSQRLLAAHAVVVVTAYFDALAEVGPPGGRLPAAEQVAQLDGGAPGDPQLRALADRLLRADVPVPAPQWPYEDTVAALGGFYRRLSEAVLGFLTGLAGWDRLDETCRGRFAAAVTGAVPERAVARYEEAFRRLATDCPEVAFWANLVDHQATRQRLDRLGTGLAEIERVLAALVAERRPDERRLALARVYRAALDRPVLDSDDAPAEVRIPPLGDAYIDPDFRVAEIALSDRPAEESWWDGHPVRSDLTGFLLGHLTAPAATTAPLLVLGQPGSGKSVLTKVLAARLPAPDFLVVRVPLRDAPADADVQTQVEYGVRTACGETLSWPELARTADGALPVVLLDGFDELLQATGVTQSDYLQNVAAFQQREADRGRPVAVLVTTRTAVADRARPVPGLVALRLEPFSAGQVERWLEVWNAHNARPGFRPLPASAALRQGELSSQPLLLLMLALYDAEGNRLQLGEAELGEAELYERLLTRFAAREVRKAGAGLPDDRLAREVDQELLRLSVVAFAMFNRRRQWVTEAELDDDLGPLLGGPPPSTAATAGFRAELSAAQLVVGRFFFMHVAQALRDDTRLRTYEFLHATFGEYLIARAVSRELRDLAEDAQRASDRSRPTQTDDGFLHALLSFAPLSLRGPAVTFLTELLAAPAWDGLREPARTLVLAWFRDSLQPRRPSSYDSYRPASVPVPARHATYAANLLVLAVLLGGEVTATELFPTSLDVKADWHKMALLWRSQLPPEGFTALVTMLDVHREWRGNDRELRITPAGPDPDLSIDPYWTYDHPAHKRGSGDGLTWGAWSVRDVDMLRRQERFLCGHDEDVLLHAVEPLIDRIRDALMGFVGYWPDRAPSMANTLLALLLMPPDEDPARLLAAYHSCVTSANFFAPGDMTTNLDDIVLRRLAADLSRLPPEAVNEILVARGDPDEGRFIELATEILPPAVLPESYRAAHLVEGFPGPVGGDEPREEDDGAVAGETRG